MVEYKDVFKCVQANMGLNLEQFKQIVKTPTHPASMRDEFAAFALQGILAKGGITYIAAVQHSYEVADLMLEERVK